MRWYDFHFPSYVAGGAMMWLFIWLNAHGYL